MGYSGLTIAVSLQMAGAKRVERVTFGPGGEYKKLFDMEFGGKTVTLDPFTVYSKTDTDSFFAHLELERLPIEIRESFPAMNPFDFMAMVNGEGLEAEEDADSSVLPFVRAGWPRTYRLPVAELKGETISGARVVDFCNALNVRYPQVMLALEEQVADLDTLIQALRAENPHLTVEKENDHSVRLANPHGGEHAAISADFGVAKELTSSEVLRYCKELRVRVPQAMRNVLQPTAREERRAERLRAEVLGVVPQLLSRNKNLAMAEAVEAEFKSLGQDEQGMAMEIPEEEIRQLMEDHEEPGQGRREEEHNNPGSHA